MILGSGDAASADTTNTVRDTQVANGALEISLARYWQSLGLRPNLLIGHSLDEYAALCVAGVLSVGDALALAYERASRRLSLQDVHLRRQACWLSASLRAQSGGASGIC